jgi:hypothetical protein
LPIPAAWPIDDAVEPVDPVEVVDVVLAMLDVIPDSSS